MSDQEIERRKKKTKKRPRDPVEPSVPSIPSLGPQARYPVPAILQILSRNSSLLTSTADIGTSTGLQSSLPAPLGLTQSALSIGYSGFSSPQGQFALPLASAESTISSQKTLSIGQVIDLSSGDEPSGEFLPKKRDLKSLTKSNSCPTNDQDTSLYGLFLQAFDASSSMSLSSKSRNSRSEMLLKLIVVTLLGLKNNSNSPFRTINLPDRISPQDERRLGDVMTREGWQDLAHFMSKPHILAAAGLYGKLPDQILPDLNAIETGDYCDISDDSPLGFTSIHIIESHQTPAYQPHTLYVNKTDRTIHWYDPLIISKQGTHFFSGHIKHRGPKLKNFFLQNPKIINSKRGITDFQNILGMSLLGAVGDKYPRVWNIIWRWRLANNKTDMNRPKNIPKGINKVLKRWLSHLNRSVPSSVVEISSLAPENSGEIPSLEMLSRLRAAQRDKPMQDTSTAMEVDSAQDLTEASGGIDFDLFPESMSDQDPAQPMAACSSTSISKSHDDMAGSLQDEKTRQPREDKNISQLMGFMRQGSPDVYEFFIKTFEATTRLNARTDARKSKESRSEMIRNLIVVTLQRLKKDPSKPLGDFTFSDIISDIDIQVLMNCMTEQGLRELAHFMKKDDILQAAKKYRVTEDRILGDLNRVESRNYCDVSDDSPISFSRVELIDADEKPGYQPGILYVKKDEWTMHWHDPFKVSQQANNFCSGSVKIKVDDFEFSNFFSGHGKVLELPREITDFQVLCGVFDRQSTAETYPSFWNIICRWRFNYNKTVANRPEKITRGIAEVLSRWLPRLHISAEIFPLPPATTSVADTESVSESSVELSMSLPQSSAETLSTVLLDADKPQTFYELFLKSFETNTSLDAHSQAIRSGMIVELMVVTLQRLKEDPAKPLGDYTFPDELSEADIERLKNIVTTEALQEFAHFIVKEDVMQLSGAAGEIVSKKIKDALTAVEERDYCDLSEDSSFVMTAIQLIKSGGTPAYVPGTLYIEKDRGVLHWFDLLNASKQGSQFCSNSSFMKQRPEAFKKFSAADYVEITSAEGIADFRELFSVSAKSTTRFVREIHVRLWNIISRWRFHHSKTAANKPKRITPAIIEVLDKWFPGQNFSIDPLSPVVTSSAVASSSADSSSSSSSAQETVLMSDAAPMQSAAVAELATIDAKEVKREESCPFLMSDEDPNPQVVSTGPDALSGSLFAVQGDDQETEVESSLPMRESKQHAMLLEEPPRALPSPSLSIPRVEIIPGNQVAVPETVIRQASLDVAELLVQMVDVDPETVESNDDMELDAEHELSEDSCEALEPLFPPFESGAPISPQSQQTRTDEKHSARPEHKLTRSTSSSSSFQMQASESQQAGLISQGHKEIREEKMELINRQSSLMYRKTGSGNEIKNDYCTFNGLKFARGLFLRDIRGELIPLSNKKRIPVFIRMENGDLIQVFRCARALGIADIDLVGKVKKSRKNMESVTEEDRERARKNLNKQIQKGLELAGKFGLPKPQLMPKITDPEHLVPESNPIVEESASNRLGPTSPEGEDIIELEDSRSTQNATDLSFENHSARPEQGRRTKSTSSSSSFRMQPSESQQVGLISQGREEEGEAEAESVNPEYAVRQRIIITNDYCTVNGLKFDRGVSLRDIYGELMPHAPKKKKKYMDKPIFVRMNNEDLIQVFRVRTKAQYVARIDLNGNVFAKKKPRKNPKPITDAEREEAGKIVNRQIQNGLELAKKLGLPPPQLMPKIIDPEHLAPEADPIVGESASNRLGSTSLSPEGEDIIELEGSRSTQNAAALSLSTPLSSSFEMQLPESQQAALTSQGREERKEEKMESVGPESSLGYRKTGARYNDAYCTSNGLKFVSGILLRDISGELIPLSNNKHILTFIHMNNGDRIQVFCCSKTLFIARIDLDGNVFAKNTKKRKRPITDKEYEQDRRSVHEQIQEGLELGKMLVPQFIPQLIPKIIDPGHLVPEADPIVGESASNRLRPTNSERDDIVELEGSRSTQNAAALSLSTPLSSSFEMQLPESQQVALISQGQEEIREEKMESVSPESSLEYKKTGGGYKNDYCTFNGLKFDREILLRDICGKLIPLSDKKHIPMFIHMNNGDLVQVFRCSTALYLARIDLAGNVKKPRRNNVVISDVDRAKARKSVYNQIQKGLELARKFGLPQPQLMPKITDPEHLVPESNPIVEESASNRLEPTSREREVESLNPESPLEYRKTGENSNGYCTFNGLKFDKGILLRDIRGELMLHAPYKYKDTPVFIHMNNGDRIQVFHIHKRAQYVARIDLNGNVFAKKKPRKNPKPITDAEREEAGKIVNRQIQNGLELAKKLGFPPPQLMPKIIDPEHLVPEANPIVEEIVDTRLSTSLNPEGEDILEDSGSTWGAGATESSSSFSTAQAMTSRGFFGAGSSQRAVGLGESFTAGGVPPQDQALRGELTLDSTRVSQAGFWGQRGQGYPSMLPADPQYGTGSDIPDSQLDIDL